MADTEELILALSEPDFYPHEPKKVEVLQTSSSVLFLADDLVYKLKKPLGLVDQNYSTPARRRRMCNLEVELASRLSPDLYNDVHKITRRKDGYAFNGRGKVVDYVIEMKRLDEKKSLTSLIERDKVTDAMLVQLGRKLASFHRDAERRQLINSFSRPHIIARQWDRRLRESARYVRTIFSAQAYTDIVTFASSFLSEHRSLLQSRIDHGFICDGHGDLNSSHIFFDFDDIQVIDPIEYNDRRRYGDVALDIAALVLSFDSLGTPDLADKLIEEYENFSGGEIESVLKFYLCFRAYDLALRYSKFATAPDIQLEEHQRLMRRARRYYFLAHRYSRGDRQPIMVIMSGVMGAGKSRLAEALSDVLSINYLHAAGDQEYFPRADEEGEDEVAESVDAAYQELFKKAEKRLKRGRSVVLDAAFHNSTVRVHARTLARKYNAEFMLVECDTDEEIIQQRLREQKDGAEETAKERLKLLREQRQAFRPSREIYRKDKVLVDTSVGLDEQIEAVLEQL